jgi:hypothetical protein
LCHCFPRIDQLTNCQHKVAESHVRGVWAGLALT